MGTKGTCSLTGIQLMLHVLLIEIQLYKHVIINQKTIKFKVKYSLFTLLLLHYYIILRAFRARFSFLISNNFIKRRENRIKSLIISKKKLNFILKRVKYYFHLN